MLKEKPKKYHAAIKTLLKANTNPERAAKMKAYMRGKYAYWGLTSPVRKELLKPFFKENGYPEGSDLKVFVTLCWKDDQREMQYTAMDAMEKRLKKMDESFVDLFEIFILEKSWWDTVDFLAPRAGLIMLRYPKMIKPYTNRWIESDNIWLQRSAILHQLKFKEETNEKLLFQHIKRRAHSQEFFVQKASGWALRQYARFNLKAVKDFVAKHHDELSNLTQKEALKGR